MFDLIKKKFRLKLTEDKTTGLLLYNGVPIYSDGDFCCFPEIINYIDISPVYKIGYNLVSTMGYVDELVFSKNISKHFVIIHENNCLWKMTNNIRLFRIAGKYYDFSLITKETAIVDFSVISDFYPGIFTMNLGITVNHLGNYIYLLGIWGGTLVYSFKMIDYEVLDCYQFTITLKNRRNNTSFNCLFAQDEHGVIGFHTSSGKTIPVNAEICKSYTNTLGDRIHIFNGKKYTYKFIEGKISLVCIETEV